MIFQQSSWKNFTPYYPYAVHDNLHKVFISRNPFGPLQKLTLTYTLWETRIFPLEKPPYIHLHHLLYMLNKRNFRYPFYRTPQVNHIFYTDVPHTIYTHSYLFDVPKVRRPGKSREPPTFNPPVTTLTTDQPSTTIHSSFFSVTRCLSVSLKMTGKSKNIGNKNKLLQWTNVG